MVVMKPNTYQKEPRSKRMQHTIWAITGLHEVILHNLLGSLVVCLVAGESNTLVTQLHRCKLHCPIIRGRVQNHHTMIAFDMSLEYVGTQCCKVKLLLYPFILFYMVYIKRWEV